jgi:hypothetical protein
MSKQKVLTLYNDLSNLLDVHNIWDKRVKIFICDEVGLQLIYKPKEKEIYTVKRGKL